MVYPGVAIVYPIVEKEVKNEKISIFVESSIVIV